MFSTDQIADILTRLFTALQINSMGKPTVLKSWNVSYRHYQKTAWQSAMLSYFYMLVNPLPLSVEIPF